MMKDIHYCKDLHDPIHGDSAKPKGEYSAELENENRKAIGYI